MVPVQDLTVNYSLFESRAARALMVGGCFYRCTTLRLQVSINGSKMQPSSCGKARPG